MKNRKSGFTLIELCVVIGILLALAAAMIGVFGTGTESARATKCLANMRNLGLAVQAKGMSDGWWPAAGNYQTTGIASENGSYTTGYDGVRGWIGWNDNGRDAYKHATGSSGPISSGFFSPFCDGQKDPERGSYFAVTNGNIWSSVNDFDSYVCPSHVRLMKKKGLTPMWSYVMNSYFGYDWTGAQKSAYTRGGGRREFGKLNQSTERTLLFAELPFLAIKNCSVDLADGKRSAGDWKCDGVLQFDDGRWTGTEEIIGFNHEGGQKTIFAHVVFADCHTEQYKLPKNPSLNQLRAFTKFLCKGVAVTYQNGRYVDPDGNSE